MPIPTVEREEYFLKHGSELIKNFQIHKSKDAEYLDAQRVGHVFMELMVKIYGGMIGQDALICFRDWSLETKLRCNQIDEMELDGDKKKKNAFFNPSVRVDERLSFVKYTRLLEHLLCPPRRPLTKRTPVTSLKILT